MSDLWNYLQSTPKPIVMYGMGNGADKILSVLEKYNVTVADFFASDGFVRGHSFHGKRVLSFSEIKEKYSDFIILLSFGSSLPEVLERIYAMAEEYEMYAPDVPVCAGEIFDISFYNANIKDITSAKELLSDRLSKSIYDDIISYKLTGDIKYLRSSFVSKDEVFQGLLTPEKYKTYVDLGAYNGDTIRELLAYGACPERIVAFEPDRRSFRKLSEYAKDIPNIELHNEGVWSEDTVLCFSDEGNRNSGVSAKGSEITVRALGNVDSCRMADYIKYDVEGSERRALEGSATIIRERHPDLLVSLYHRSEDIFSLIHYVNSLCPGYKLYLRRFEYVPAWDLCLIAKYNDN